jgi:hypothetical protein
MPTDEPHSAPATAEVALAAGGNLTQVAYTWSHPQDGEQTGLLVLGQGEEPGAVVALWGDSWHQAPEPRWLTGREDQAVVSVGYEYAEGWEWTITVDSSDTGALRLRMDNVVPESAAGEGQAGAYWAMEAVLHRSP